ncbi:FAD-linked oxidoreductase-like protein, partial [Cladochytrium replicatum]
TPDLINSYLVFQLCRIPQLPALAGPVIYAAEKAKVLEAPVYSVVKSTFFKHFCGGEDIREVSPTMARFAAKGVGSILDLAMEADLDDTSLSGESAAQEAARVRALMEESIDTASSQPDSFIAVKVTAFVPPATLVRWTNTLRAFEASFNSALDNTDSHGLSRAEFVRAFLEFAKVRDPVAVAKIAGRIEALFPSADSNGDGRVDWIEASELFSLSSPEVREVLLQAIKSNPQDAQTDPATALATAEDLITIDLVMAELDLLCGYAKKRGVKIMIDAEQSYFQAAIDDVALTLLQRFNPSLADGQSGAPTVYNTYQMYLRDSYQRLVADVERAKRLNHAFGAKIVRGAYMVAERARAAELSYPDPIHPNLEATHHAYNSAIDFLLSHVKENTEHGSVSPVSFVIASHNGKSVQHAVKQLEQMPESARKHVAFAQLMGMQDGTTFRLAENGWKAYKYVPYGPIHVTIPYLLRRATENSGMLSGASSDRDSLWEEIWGRLKGRA